MVNSTLREHIAQEQFHDSPLIGVGSLVPDDLFDAFKRRAIGVKKEDIDLLMWDVIQAMNEIDGIATVWCCSGHEKGWFKRFTESNYYNRIGHIGWVGKNSDFKRVDSFFKHLVLAAWDEELVFKGVQLTTLREPPIREWVSYGRYPIFWAEWYLENVRQRQEEMKRLTNHIRRFRG